MGETKYRDLRIFGFPVYIHVPKEKRMKWEPYGNKGMIVGYNETSKAYHIYIPGQWYVEVSRGVRFEEDLEFMRSHDTTIGREE